MTVTQKLGDLRNPSAADRKARSNLAQCPRTGQDVGTRESHGAGPEGHLKVARRVGASVRDHAGQRGAYLRGEVRLAVFPFPRRRYLSTHNARLEKRTDRSGKAIPYTSTNVTISAYFP